MMYKRGRIGRNVEQFLSEGNDDTARCSLVIPPCSLTPLPTVLMPQCCFCYVPLLYLVEQDFSRHMEVSWSVWAFHWEGSWSALCHLIGSSSMKGSAVQPEHPGSGANPVSWSHSRRSLKVVLLWINPLPLSSSSLDFSVIVWRNTAVRQMVQALLLSGLDVADCLAG